MHAYLTDLLRDQKGGAIFECFGIWHILYMAVIFGAIGLCLCLLKGKARSRAVEFAICFAFGLYVLDFFLMPFAYGRIDIEKLPFHACTAMCVLSFLSRRVEFLEPFKGQFALLGLVSNLVYVIYPAGVGWYQIHPLSYRVVQTLLFHGVMTAYGIFCLPFEDVQLCWKNWKKELLTVAGMTLWALLGNTLYNGLDGRFFNWFFVVRDPFYILPKDLAPYVMPFLVTAVFFGVEMLIYLLVNGRRKH